MKFALLASGSKGNCFYLQDESLSIIVDCGSTKRHLTTCLDELGVKINELDALLITHEHTDHISQLKMFENVETYSPIKLSDRSVHHVEPTVPFQLQHMTITPLALSHDADITVGYIFETWQEKLVYVTDTGYVKNAYQDLMKGADYIVLESNHDVEMLMNTSRPQFLKSRIAGDSGHLSNQDCATILDNIVTSKTKMVILAHISREANTQQKALETSVEVLKRHNLHKDMMVVAAGQYELIKGGDWHEKMGVYSFSSTFTME